MICVCSVCYIYVCECVCGLMSVVHVCVMCICVQYMVCTYVCASECVCSLVCV